MTEEVIKNANRKCPTTETVLLSIHFSSLGRVTHLYFLINFEIHIADNWQSNIDSAWSCLLTVHLQIHNADNWQYNID